MEPSLEEYVSARGQALLRLAYLLVGDVTEAQDVVQGVLYRITAKWARVRHVEDLDAYVRAAVANAAASWWRERRRRLTMPSASVPELADSEAAYADRELFMRLLRELPPRQRAVIVLRYYEDLTEGQTAAVLGCSVGTVKSQSAKARDTLKRRLEASRESMRGTGHA